MAVSPHCSVAAILHVVATGAALAADTPLVTREALQGRIMLSEGWRFRAGDDPSWAAPDLDDSNWTEVDTSLHPVTRPKEWQGIGWFRLRITVDPEIRSVPLGLEWGQLGASEIYLDGRLLGRFGTVAASPEREMAMFVREPLIVAVGAPSRLLAVRYSNSSHESLNGAEGFSMWLYEANRMASGFVEERMWMAATRMGLVASGLVVAFVHMLLYLFYRKHRESLVLALVALAFASLYASIYASSLATHPPTARFLGVGAFVFAMMGVLLSLRFLYLAFGIRTPRYYWLLAVSAPPILAWHGSGYGPSRNASRVLWTWFLLTVIETIRVIVSAVAVKRPGSRIVGAGFLLFSGAAGMEALKNLGVIPWAPHTGEAFLGLLVAMSMMLSRSYARTSIDLERQLQHVKELSEKALAQERRVHEAEMGKRLIEADHARKSEELERARKLQLSMLPKAAPVHPEVEVVFRTETATEVGGDYFDFLAREDGGLVIALGDATGHGMDSALLITAAKSLLHASPGSDGEALRRIALGIRKLGLSRMNMALLLARHEAGSLVLASAGMPPVLILRAGTRGVEEVLTPAPPLGAVASFPYVERRVPFAAGDLALLFSDGLPEATNAGGDQLGYGPIEQILKENRQGPEELIEQVLALGRDWRGGCAPQDDITLAVIRARPGQ